MPSTLASALDAARVRAFVGRQAELAAFESALAGRGTPRVLFIHGPGGIGKTTLLHQFRIRASRRADRSVELDAREIDCSPESFRAAFDRLARRIAARRSAPPIRAAGAVARRLRPAGPARRMDARRSSCHRCPPTRWSSWSAGTPPASPWRTDPGWRALASRAPTRTR